jgi:hypothetical protein
MSHTPETIRKFPGPTLTIGYSTVDLRLACGVLAAVQTEYCCEPRTEICQDSEGGRKRLPINDPSKLDFSRIPP